MRKRMSIFTINITYHNLKFERRKHLEIDEKLAHFLHLTDLYSK